MQVHHRDLTQFFASARKNTHAEISAMGIRNRDMTSNLEPVFRYVLPNQRYQLYCSLFDPQKTLLIAVKFSILILLA